MKKPITKKQPIDSQMPHDITALKAENLKLQRQISKLKAEQVTLRSKIIILEENTNDRCIHKTLPIECVEKSIIETDKQIKQTEGRLKKLENKR
jgi:predicted RNase H-like nuclease (RuvC/YqgF family)